jgi:hypothetical protein
MSLQFETLGKAYCSFPTKSKMKGEHAFHVRHHAMSLVVPTAYEFIFLGKCHFPVNFLQNHRARRLFRRAPPYESFPTIIRREKHVMGRIVGKNNRREKHVMGSETSLCYT